MAKFDVTVEGKTYEVDAPNENVAWKWANQTHAQVKQAHTPKSADPSEGELELRPFGISTGVMMPQGVSRFAAGAGKAFTDLLRGAGQLVGAVSPEDIENARRLDAPLMATGAGTAGNISGNVAATLPTAFIPGANTVLGGAAIGGALGAIQPTSKDESRLANAVSGAVAGGAVPAAINVFKAGKAALYDPIASQEKIIGGALRRSFADSNQAAEVAKALRSGGKAATPGVNFTAGTIANNEGLSALEDALRSQFPQGELARNLRSSNTALANTLRGVAGTPDDIAQAMAMRESVSGNLYNQARAAGVNPASLTPEAQANIAAFQKRVPEDVMNKAREIAKISGVDLDNESAVQGMHWVKKAIDNKIGAATRSGEGDLARAYTSLRDDLLQGMDEISPLYQQARQSYQKLSQPISQMQVGTALANKLIPATAGDVPSSLNYSQLARAMRDPNAVAQSATGFSGAKMGQIMSPEQMASIQGVTSDASRLAENLRLGMGAGSPTARRLTQGDMISQHLMQEAPVTANVMQLLGRIPGVNLATRGVSSVASMASDAASANMLQKMESMLANNPAQVGKLIEQELAKMPLTYQQQVRRALVNVPMLALPSINTAQQ